jgi:hypothetical protein
MFEQAIFECRPFECKNAIKTQGIILKTAEKLMKRANLSLENQIKEYR